MDEIKVLIVEDQDWAQQEFKEALKDKVTVLSALTIKQAERLFFENPEIDAIAIDPCVPGQHPNTLALIREFKKKFAGPMIAMSGSPALRFHLKKAGCNYESPKTQMPKKLLEILHLNQPIANNQI